MFRLGFVLLVLLGMNQAFADEVTWIRLSLDIRYADVDKKCDNIANDGSSLHDAKIFLALQMNGGKVVAAQLNNYPKIYPYSLAIYKGLRLLPEELSNLAIFIDGKGRPWAKEWRLSERLAKWIAFEGSRTGLLCKMVLPLSTLNPAKPILAFELEGPGQGIDISYGNWVKWEGTRQDGRAYQVELRLVQEQEQSRP